MRKSHLLATKLHRPPLPAKWVQRPHLAQRLNEGLEIGRQISLISAPAGFGKTICISEWVETLDRWPVAWLSLDPADNDPGRFFAYLVAALQQVRRTLGQEIEGVLRAGQLPPAEVISAALINDILSLKNRCLLVLDDFHVIQDRFILQVLEELITNLPHPLHLVLLTREDPPLPLARLRANNRLTEIRARDLRFTTKDAESFLNGVMNLLLSPTDIAVLEDKTEGWIAGLQLAGLSIRDRTDPSDFIAALSGSHRFILGYLTEQVLDQQPAEIRDFLLQTSILDKITGDLCQALTGRSDSPVLLEQLFKANLFLIPLDDEGRWYRYHHLFADLLRDLQNDAFPKDRTAELHQRASRWYAQAGMAGEAVQHALAADAYALAVDLLEGHAMEMVMQGYAQTVNGWVQRIPEEWRSQSPRTNLAFAWMHFLRGAYAQAFPHLERLQASLADSQEGRRSGEEKASLRAEWLVMQSLMLNMQGRATESLAAATQALEIVPGQDGRVQSLAYYALATAYQMIEDYPRAVESYQLAIQRGRAADNYVAEMLSAVGLARMAFEHGQLRLAFEIATPVIARIERSATLPPISAVMYGLLGEVWYQWFRLKEARRHTRRALQLSTLGGYNSGMAFCRVLLSRLSHLEGDLESAGREIQTAVDLVQGQTPDYVRQEVIAQQVRLYLARDQAAAAQMALQGQGFSFGERFSFPDLPAEGGISHSRGLLYTTSLHLLLYQARTRDDLTHLSSGIELAGRLIAGALAGQALLVALEALLLRAQMHTALGDSDAHLAASQADTVRALELAEPEGVIGLFVDQGPPVARALANLVRQNRLGTVQPGYVERILAAFSGAQSPDPTGREPLAPELPGESDPASLIEPLTDRELEVLRLIAQGLKYKEIAARLFVSLNTVRFHVKAIYGKLNVNNRTQAVETARRLRIL